MSCRYFNKYGAVHKSQKTARALRVAVNAMQHNATPYTLQSNQIKTHPPNPPPRLTPTSPTTPSTRRPNTSSQTPPSPPSTLPSS